MRNVKTVIRRYLRRTLPVLLPVLGVAGLTVAYVARASPSAPVVPMLLGVQGYVTDAMGNPITGSQQVTLALYTTDVGGTSVFSESQQVAFDHGIMSTQLGRNTPLDPASVVYPNPQLFLGVSIGGGTELAPRIRITSATYAIQAQHAAQADVAANGVPPGTITAYGGATAPAGWLLCDGSIIDPVAQPQYAALRAAIVEAWGDGGDGAQPKFTLPDLRGMFLRGVDGSGQRDPDVASRTAPWRGTGNSGNAVGSSEGSTFTSHGHGVNDPGHAHTLPRGNFLSGPDNSTPGSAGQWAAAQFNGLVENMWSATAATGTGISISQSGGAETRPINAAVNYIIKY